MSKDTNFSGHPVLSQIIKLINRDKVNELATTTKVNRYVKSFDAFTHLVVMIYAALSGAKSIRQVVEGFEANVTRLNHLGIAYLVRRSTLSDANKKRTSQFFGDVYKALYERYSPLLSDSKASKALQKGLYILDSTTISLFSQILKGVGRTPKNNKKKGGIKAHTLLEASCVLPSFVDYSAAAIHDHSRMSSILSLPSGSFVTFDMSSLEELQDMYSHKVDNIASYIKNLENLNDAIKNEKKALDERMKQNERKAERLKNYLTMSLNEHGYSNFETPRIFSALYIIGFLYVPIGTLKYPFLFTRYNPLKQV